MMSGTFIGLSARVDGPYGVGMPQITLLNSWLFDLGVAAHIWEKANVLTEATREEWLCLTIVLILAYVLY